MGRGCTRSLLGGEARPARPGRFCDDFSCSTPERQGSRTSYAVSREARATGYKCPYSHPEHLQSGQLSTSETRRVRCKSSPPVIAATARRDVDCNDFFLRAPHMHAHVSKGVLNRTTLPKPGEKVVPKKVIPVSPSGCKTNKNSTVSSTLSLEEL